MPDVSRTNGQRPRSAVALRLAGAPYGDIAEALGYASSHEARHAVEKELALASEDEQGRAVLRGEAAARLERLMRSVWSKAIDPNDPEHLPAVRVAMSLVDRHIRLLGLDAPTEVIVHTPTTTEIDAWVAEMLRMRAAGDVVEGEVLADLLDIEALAEAPE